MDKEKIETRLKQLEDERLKLTLAYDGAIQDCKYWIQQFDPPKQEQEDKVDEQDKPQ